MHLEKTEEPNGSHGGRRWLRLVTAVHSLYFTKYWPAKVPSRYTRTLPPVRWGKSFSRRSLLLLDGQIAHDHSMIRVPRLARRHGFGSEALAHPNLVNSKERVVIRARGSPTMSGFPECITQSLLERCQRMIIGLRIEITANNQVTGRGNVLDMLHDAKHLFTVLNPSVAMVGPESRRPKIETKNRGRQACANDMCPDTSW